MLRTAPVLGMPFTNTVARAKPGGKPQTGAEAKELVCQLVERTNMVCPLSRARNCTRG